MPAEMVPNVTASGGDSRARLPCQFFAQNRCRNGASCAFSHAEDTSKKTSTSPFEGLRDLRSSLPPRAPSQTDTRSHIPCRFFLQGSCSKGDGCPFAHDNPAGASEAVPDTEEHDLVPESWCRELKGALVTFGDGAVVAKLRLPSDFSAVRINGLAPDATSLSVVDLLATLGFSIPQECIRLVAPDSLALRSADVRVDDPSFAMGLCSMMNSGSGPKAVPIDAPMPQTTNHGRVDSRKVYCSWHKPTRTAWLNFGSGDIATKIASRFSAGAYKILEHRVECEVPKRSSGARNPLAWTVMLSGVPGVAKSKDVVSSIPTAMAPRHVELSAASYTADLPSVNKMIESLMLQAGPLERWTGGSPDPGKRFKAQARFMHDADARQAVNLFHNKSFALIRPAKLTVQLVYTTRFKIRARVYDVVEQEMAAPRQAWAAQHLQYLAYPPALGFRVLKIEGLSAKDLANAKATVESIIAGEVVMKDDQPLWAASFATNGRSRQRMRELERELGILIIRDRRRSQLRLLGPQACRAEARLVLIELARDDSSSTFVIELDGQQCARAVKGGFRAIGATIGNDKATLDIASRPPRIIVAGSEEDFSTAKRILRDVPAVVAVNRAEIRAEDGGGDCAICWTEAENPVQTPCKHTYCAGCFEDLCVAGASEGAPIHCRGEADKCGAVLPLAELQAHLPSASLEDLLEAALAAHIARHPNDLKHCPTPDCGQLYRAAEAETTNKDNSTPTATTCPACLAAICTSCGHPAHEGMSCASRRDLASDSPQARLLAAQKAELGIKDCPRCGIMIEKTEGCNHMTCSACEAHICWVCLKTFAAGRFVYDHLTREHGGIFELPRGLF